MPRAPVVERVTFFVLPQKAQMSAKFQFWHPLKVPPMKLRDSGVNGTVNKESYVCVSKRTKPFRLPRESRQFVGVSRCRYFGNLPCCSVRTAGVKSGHVIYGGVGGKARPWSRDLAARMDKILTRNQNGPTRSHFPYKLT